MLTITVSILGLKNRPFQKETISVNREKLTVGELLQLLDERYHTRIEEEIIDREILKTTYVILLNGRSIGSLNKLSSNVADGDNILLTVFTAGG